MTTQTVFVGTNDEISITANTALLDEGTQTDVLTPIPFLTNGTTKIEISFSDQVKNSVDDAAMISFTDDGEIVLKLGSLATVVKDRSHPVIIRAFDPVHPLGQTIVAPSRTDSNLSLIFK